MQPNRKDLFRTTEADHRIIEASINSFRRMSNGDSPQDAPKEIDALKLFLTDMLPKHFAYEEEKIFPLLLADNPSENIMRLILELKEEHKRLLVELGDLSVELSSRNLMQNTGVLWMDCLALFNRLRIHASKEDKLFRLVSN
jgi:iron-sulfur cluster repair protein YtfE (RIC family)